MIVTIKKRNIAIVVILIAIIATLSGILTSESLETAVASSRKIPVYNVETEEKQVALTFDAAWGADKTSEIMDILEEYNMTATFFLVGFWVDEYEDLVKEIDARGFLIGNHSTNHYDMVTISDVEVLDEIITTSQKIQELVGYTPEYFRAPYGSYNNDLITAVEDNGMQCIQWSIDSLDWTGISGSEIAENILNEVDCGDIILCHNNSDYILDALPLIMIGLQTQGLTSVGLDELVLADNYSINNNGTQIANN
ncbi:MAG: polysaccharide deacetylase family protein [Bacillota bacterium]